MSLHNSREMVRCATRRSLVPVATASGAEDSENVCAEVADTREGSCRRDRDARLRDARCRAHGGRA